MKKALILLGVLCAVAFAAPKASAAEPTSLGDFGKWGAYTFKEGDKKACYIAAKPTKAEGKYTYRGSVYAMVTHYPDDSETNVFSYKAGYDYKPDAEVSLTIGEETFTLIGKGDKAWAADADTDAKIAEAISKGSRMVVKGTSARGTETTDTFSLSGSGAAYKAAGKECGV